MVFLGIRPEEYRLEAAMGLIFPTSFKIFENLVQ
jgi:hypothetical protein